MKIHVKRGNESHFLYETVSEIGMNDLIRELVVIFNGRLAIQRLFVDLSELCKYGVSRSTGVGESNSDEEENAELYTPRGGCIENADPAGKRNGRAPNEETADVIRRTVAEAKSIICEESVAADQCITKSKLTDVSEMLRGAVSIVYPMGLPDYEPVQQEFNNLQKSLEGNQTFKETLNSETAELWWAGKQLHREKKLKDFVGMNEKTKIVVQLQKSGVGAPSREPAMSEEEKRQLMLHTYKRQEELKRLEEDSDHSYLDSQWADRQSLHKSFHGIENVKWN